MERLKIIILLPAFLSLFGCVGFGGSAKVGEPFTLKTNESATVRGTGIQITLNRIGRKWLADGGGESLDLEFSVKHGGNTETYSESSPDPITAGEYKIEIVKTEPFGEGCVIFVVNKNEAANQKTDKAASKSDIYSFVKTN